MFSSCQTSSTFLLLNPQIEVGCVNSGGLWKETLCVCVCVYCQSGFSTSCGTDSTVSIFYFNNICWYHNCSHSKKNNSFQADICLTCIWIELYDNASENKSYKKEYMWKLAGWQKLDKVGFSGPIHSPWTDCFKVLQSKFHTERAEIPMLVITITINEHFEVKEVLFLEQFLWVWLYSIGLVWWFGLH